jgi:hypothetical protein
MVHGCGHTLNQQPEPEEAATLFSLGLFLTLPPSVNEGTSSVDFFPLGQRLFTLFDREDSLHPLQALYSQSRRRRGIL